MTWLWWALLPFNLFVYYLAFATIHKAKKNGNIARASFVVRGLSYVIVVLGLAMDVVFNATFGTAMFLQWPKEWLFTGRCKSHLEAQTWRGALARWICRNALDPFEEGGHC
jgi:hypothetical protein